MLAIVGTQNSHNIVTLSNDGKLCVWNPSMLNAPEKTFELKPKNKPEDPLNATSICFPESEANHFYVGNEDGIIYSAQVHAK
jgi:dynein intermediate chain